MISRLTASAALFAVLATAGLTVAAEGPQRTGAPRADAVVSMPTATMPRVEVTGKRLPGR